MESGDYDNYDTHEDMYPFLINEILKYIEYLKSNGCDISLLDIVLEYAFKHGISVEVIGDAIASDEYFKSFIEKDCELNNFIQTGAKLDEW